MTTTQNPAPLASVTTARFGDATGPAATEALSVLNPQVHALAVHISPMADTLASYNRSAAVIVDKSDLFTMLEALDRLAAAGGGYQSEVAGRMARDLRYGMTVAGVIA